MSIPDRVLKEFVSMGFNEQLLREAWRSCKGQEAALLDEYQFLQANNQKILSESSKPVDVSRLTNNMDEENQINQAIMDSVQDSKEKYISFEPLNPEQRQRKEGVPVGLKNLGNTCYINPLVQVYFHNTVFFHALMQFSKPSEEEIREMLHIQGDADVATLSSDQAAYLRKVRSSVNLVSALQDLYIQLVGSDKKYIDPTTVVKSLVDDLGNPLQIGEQQDICEFNLIFLARIEEGLKHSRGAFRRGGMEIESEGENKELSMIQKNFFGSNVVMMNYQLGEENFHKQEKEAFNVLFLDIKHKDLYNALDEYVVNQIDEFKNDRGDIVAATKHNWLRRAPQTLFFQLQRVVFDLNTKSLVKLNDHFQIEKEIYMERFTEQRREDYLRIRENVKKLVIQKSKYESALEAITSFGGDSNSSKSLTSSRSSGGDTPTPGDNGCGFHLLTVLSSTCAFLEENSGKHQVDQLERSTFFGENARDNQHIISTLKSYQRQIFDRIANLSKSITDLQGKITQSYTSFKKERYVLQSVLIHDGLAESGHYYAFVNDIQQNKWWRYNDIQVTEETEANVFKEAVGGWGKASAYSLIYVKEEVALAPPQFQHIVLRSHSLVSSSNASLDYYRMLISEDKLNNLTVENIKFQEEIDEYKANISAKAIVDLYLKRFELNNECARKSDEARKKVKGSPPPFIQFCVYLKLHAENEKNQYDETIKLLVLEACVREVTKNAQNLRKLTDIKLKERLTSLLSDLPTFKKLSNIVITDGMQEKIANLHSEFLKQMKNAESMIFSMQSALKSDWTASLSAMDYLIDLNNFQDATQQANLKDDYFFKIQRDTKIIILTAFLHFLEVHARDTNTDPNILLRQIKSFISFYKKQVKFDHKQQLTFSAWISDIIQSTSNAKLIAEVKPLLDYYMSAAPNRFREAEDLISNLPAELNDRYQKLSLEGDMYYWNANKKEDCLFNELISNFEKIKVTFAAYISFTMDLRKSTVPLFAHNRNLHK